MEEKIKKNSRGSRARERKKMKKNE